MGKLRMLEMIVAALTFKNLIKNVKRDSFLLITAVKHSSTGNYVLTKTVKICGTEKTLFATTGSFQSSARLFPPQSIIGISSILNPRRHLPKSPFHFDDDYDTGVRLTDEQKSAQKQRLARQDSRMKFRLQLRQSGPLAKAVAVRSNLVAIESGTSRVNKSFFKAKFVSFHALVACLKLNICSSGRLPDDLSCEDVPTRNTYETRIPADSLDERLGDPFSIGPGQLYVYI
ncbi:7737_t:CDS:2 [Paraglomus occultum]|uniref:7737_t:CDS:1 n=1 Tax=Paraglomus occultum TaxID=144539 RepID=A0A9N9BFY4_9GLOM|nr:7737_t:CDS:2 [Paraglomus occultum]